MCGALPKKKSHCKQFPRAKRLVESRNKFCCTPSAWSPPVFHFTCCYEVWGLMRRLPSAWQLPRSLFSICGTCALEIDWMWDAPYLESCVRFVTESMATECSLSRRKDTKSTQKFKQFPRKRKLSA